MLAAATTIIASLLPLSFALRIPSAYSPPTPQAQSPFQLIKPDAKRVPVTLGVMSRCPDSEVCETLFDRVLDSVGGIVDINAEYIGTIDDSAPHGVTCLHGEAECIGNIQQLCAYKYWRKDDDTEPWADWWNFIQCLNYGPTSRIGDRQVARACAKVVSRDWVDSGVRQCVASSEGSDLLKDSVRKMQKENVKKSCTVIINHKVVCIHDGTWKNCESGHEVGDFVKLIRQEWKDINDEEKNKLPTLPPKVPGPGEGI